MIETSNNLHMSCTIEPLISFQRIFVMHCLLNMALLHSQQLFFRNINQHLWSCEQKIYLLKSFALSLVQD